MFFLRLTADCLLPTADGLRLPAALHAGPSLSTRTPSGLEPFPPLPPAAPAEHPNYTRRCLEINAHARKGGATPAPIAARSPLGSSPKSASGSARSSSGSASKGGEGRRPRPEAPRPRQVGGPSPHPAPSRREGGKLAGRGFLVSSSGRRGPPPQARTIGRPDPPVGPRAWGPRAAPSRAKGRESLGVRSAGPPPTRTHRRPVRFWAVPVSGRGPTAGWGRGRTTATGCRGGTVPPARDGRKRRSGRKERRPLHAKTRAATFRRRPGRREGGGERRPRGAFFPPKLVQPLCAKTVPKAQREGASDSLYPDVCCQSATVR